MKLSATMSVLVREKGREAEASPHVDRTFSVSLHQNFGRLPKALLQQLWTETNRRHDGSRTAEEVRRSSTLQSLL